MLRQEPRLGGLVEEIDLFCADAGEALAVLQLLHLLPNLTHVDGFNFISTLEGHRHLLDVAAARPRLQHLGEFADNGWIDSGDAPLVHRYFDLTALRSLDVFFYPGVGLASVGLDTVSAGLRDLAFGGSFPTSFNSPPHAYIGRFEQLESLSLDPARPLYTSLGLPDNLLASFPLLVCMAVPAGDVGPLLAASHGSLAHIKLLYAGLAGRRSGNGARAVVRAATVDPPLLPALRTVDLEGAFFANRQSPRSAWLSEVGPQFRAAGVAFFDKDDVQWQEEWEVAPEPPVLHEGASAAGFRCAIVSLARQV